MHKVSSIAIQGGEGSDKIIGGDANGEQSIYGGDLADIIYGGDFGSGDQKLFGDFMENGQTRIPILGGNDKIYGGSNIAGDQIIAGGTFDDKIFSGSNISGRQVKLYGDNDIDADGMAVNEDPNRRNMNDGNDLITIGNNNNMVFAYG